MEQPPIEATLVSSAMLQLALMVNLTQKALAHVYRVTACLTAPVNKFAGMG